LNKTDLIAAIAKNAKLSKRQAADALQATIGAVSDTLRKGQKVALIGFGTFATAMRKARTGINPQTKKAIKIAAKRIPKFKPGKELKRLVSKVK